MLDSDDFTIREGIPVTGVARTLLDLAGAIPERDLARAVDRAERLELFDLRAVDDVLLRARGKRGAVTLRRVVADYRPLNVYEGLEERFASLILDAGLCRPEFNAFVEGEARAHQVDAYWPAHNLILELDSHEFHHTLADRKRDAAKQADLELAGHRVTRLTWEDVVPQADRTLRRLERLLRSEADSPKPFPARAR
jgi:hypothetical protein